MVSTQIKVGIRTGHFEYTVMVLRQLFELELVYQDKGEEFAQFKLPSRQILEVFGLKNIWHPFTTPPDWEVIIDEVRKLRRENEQNDA